MPKIVTLTPNPAIDLSTAVERVVPSLKLRCAQPRRDPGGGGVNVARVVKRLGGDVEAILPVGGFTGELLRRLLEKEGISSCLIKAQAETREDFSVTERGTGSQYRFVLPGEPRRESEWRKCLEALGARKPSFVVGSGSLPPGVPDDFYARAAAIARKLGAKFLPGHVGCTPCCRDRARRRHDQAKLARNAGIGGKNAVLGSRLDRGCSRIHQVRKGRYSCIVSRSPRRNVDHPGPGAASPPPAHQTDQHCRGWRQFFRCDRLQPGQRRRPDRCIPAWRGRRLSGPRSGGNRTLLTR